jgi:hypothetical protein
MFFEVMPGIFQAALAGFKTKIIGGLCPVQSGGQRDQAQQSSALIIHGSILANSRVAKTCHANNLAVVFPLPLPVHRLELSGYGPSEDGSLCQP